MTTPTKTDTEILFDYIEQSNDPSLKNAAARAFLEAQEQGARWALLSYEMRLGPALVERQAARICAEGRRGQVKDSLPPR